MFKGKILRKSEAKPSKEIRGRHKDGEFSEMDSITCPLEEAEVHRRNEHDNLKRRQRNHGAQWVSQSWPGSVRAASQGSLVLELGSGEADTLQ